MIELLISLFTMPQSLSILENMSATGAANAVSFSLSEYTGTDLNLNRTEGNERNIRIFAPANVLLYYRIVDLRGNVNSTDLNDKGFNNLQYGYSELDQQELGSCYFTYDWINGFGTIFTGSDPTHPHREVSFWFDSKKNNLSPGIQQFKIEIYGDENLSVLLETLPTVTLYRTESDLLSLSSNDSIGEEQIEFAIDFVEGYAYRLRNDLTGKYIFSANSGEIDIITGQGWVNEGAAYASPADATTNLHRFSMANGGHFYTANTEEKNILSQDSSFTYEGVAYQVYSTAEPPQGSTPVVRYLSNAGSHLYSTSLLEQANLDASSDWTNEGIAWYGESI